LQGFFKQKKPLSRPFSLSRFLFAKEHVFEEQDPNEVDPAEGQTEEDDDNRHNNVDQGWMFKRRGNPDKKLDDPVDARDDQEQELDETRQRIKPFHHNRIYLPLNDIAQMCFCNVLVAFLSLAARQKGRIS